MRFLPYLLDLFLAGLVIWIGVFQMLLPTINNLPMFPFFRHKRRDVEDRIREGRESYRIGELEREAEAIQRARASQTPAPAAPAAPASDVATPPIPDTISVVTRKEPTKSKSSTKRKKHK